MFCTVVALCAAASSLYSAPPGRYITVAWDPSPDDRVVGYAVYVGTAPGRYEQVFAVGSRTYFTYSNAVPERRYYFSVVAYTAGTLVSDRSEEVSGYGQSTPAIPVSNALAVADPPGALGTLSSGGSIACADRGVAGCSQMSVIATTEGSIDALAAIGDGRLLVVEDGQRIRVFDGRAFIEGDALVASPAVRFVGIAVDPQFQQRRRVYLAEEERLVDATRELRIVRYRDVQNTFGEPAVVVAGVRLPPTGAASFTVDADGRIFVAAPSSQTNAAFTTVVLGFEPDGSSLHENRAASPIVARASLAPAAIGWDGTAQQLWLTGTEGGRSTVVRIPVRALAPSDVWPRDPRPVLSASGPVVQAGTANAVTVTTTALMLSMPAEGRLVRVRAGANDVEELSGFEPEEMTAATVDPQTKSAYVAVRIARGPRSYIFRIEE